MQENKIKKRPILNIFGFDDLLNETFFVFDDHLNETFFVDVLCL